MFSLILRRERLACPLHDDVVLLGDNVLTVVGVCDHRSPREPPKSSALTFSLVPPPPRTDPSPRASELFPLPPAKTPLATPPPKISPLLFS